MRWVSDKHGLACAGPSSRNPESDASASHESLEMAMIISLPSFSRDDSSHPRKRVGLRWGKPGFRAVLVGLAVGLLALGTKV